MQLVEYGLYTVKDEYFTDFPSDHWMWNKSQRRPHYYALKDPSGLLWLIPMSSKVENYAAKIARVERQRGAGNCLYYHIGPVGGRQSAFIISGMFPVTARYIQNAYTICAVPYVVRNTRLNRQLRSKAMRYLKLLEGGHLRDQNRVLEIRQTLLRSGAQK